MKIAFVSDNGKNVSQHFGRARYYVVVTVENGQVVKNETRDKLGHIQFASDAHHEEYHGPLHGYGPEAQHRHGKIIEDQKTIEPEAWCLRYLSSRKKIFSG